MNIKLSHCSMDLWGESSKIVDLNKPNAAGLSPSGIGLYLLQVMDTKTRQGKLRTNCETLAFVAL